MKTVRVILIILFDILFLGAFFVFFPVLVQFFSIPLAAVIITGVLVAGGGIVLFIGVLKCHRRDSDTDGTDPEDGGGLRRHM